MVGHGSLLEAVNWTGEYILKWLRKAATEGIKSVVPKSTVVDDLIRHQNEVHKSLVWTDSCKSWFKGNRADGKVSALFAGSAFLFRTLVGEIRGEDFEIEYRDEGRWGFLGNGFTQYELEPGNDLAWYVEH